MAVGAALEKLGRLATNGPLGDLDLDRPLLEILHSDGQVTPRSMSSADAVALVVMLEEEFGVSSKARRAEEPPDAWAAMVCHVLLGPAVERSTWDPDTVWTRSIRSVVNERVRHRGGCSCGEQAGRPTTA